MIKCLRIPEINDLLNELENEPIVIEILFSNNFQRILISSQSLH